MFLPGPPRLDEAGWERLLARASKEEASRLDGVDLGDVRFADPYGLLGLIALGASSRYRRGQAWGLILPRDRDVISFFERSGALSWLEKFFILADSPRTGTRLAARAPADPPVLEVAHVKDVADIHRAVARVKGRADRLIIGGLGYNSLAADRFTVALAEICQNIVDHSEGEGFVMARLMPPGRGGGRRMVRLAVVDAGIGVRRSLAGRYASRFPDSWDDRKAVRLAFQRHVSRLDEAGRGLGLKLVAEMIRGWGGRLLFRSGTAAFAISPPWGPRPRRSGLAPFPGTQINVFLPALET
jgi:hypothetical protein